MRKSNICLKMLRLAVGIYVAVTGQPETKIASGCLCVAKKERKALCAVLKLRHFLLYHVTDWFLRSAF